MTIGFEFAPDAARGRALNARMHHELGLSLQHVIDQSRDAGLFDEAAIAPLLSDLKAGVSYPATVFARYYDLVEAIVDEDFDKARGVFDQLARAKPIQDLRIDDLGSATLGENSGRYRRMMNSDPDLDLGFTDPTPEVVAEFRKRLAGGMDLLRRGLPELAGEIEAIVREIVIAGSDPTKKMQFDGGSHYQLWGALFLNGQYHPDDLAVVEVLAHESAHSLLFGFCTDQALVDNADDELYASPLRADPRPMDGIYHATFVSARMHWAMTKLAQSGVLSAEDAERARAAAAADLTNFDAGYGVVREHGQLTELGAALMAGAAQYMDGAR